MRFQTTVIESDKPGADILTERQYAFEETEEALFAMSAVGAVITLGHRTEAGDAIFLSDRPGGVNARTIPTEDLISLRLAIMERRYGVGTDSFPVHYPGGDPFLSVQQSHNFDRAIHWVTDEGSSHKRNFLESDNLALPATSAGAWMLFKLMDTLHWGALEAARNATRRGFNKLQRPAYVSSALMRVNVETVEDTGEKQVKVVVANKFQPRHHL